MSEAADGDAAMIEAAEADARWAAARRPQDDPLTDRPVDAAAAAERERSAKAAKLAAQTANAMVAVQGQLKVRLRWSGGVPLREGVEDVECRAL